MRRMAVIAVLLALLAGGAYAQSTPVRNGVLQTTLRAATNKIVELADPSTAANSMDAVNYRTLTNVVASGGSSFTGIVAGAYISGSGVAAIPVKATGLVDQVAFNTYTSAVPGSITNSMGLGAVLGVSPDALGRDATNFGLIRAEGTISCAQDIVAEGGMEAGSAISAGNSFDHGNNVGVTATALGFGGGVLTNSAPLTGMNTWLGSVGSSQAVVRTYVDAVSNMVVLASNQATTVTGILRTDLQTVSNRVDDAFSLWGGTYGNSNATITVGASTLTDIVMNTNLTGKALINSNARVSPWRVGTWEVSAQSWIASQTDTRYHQTYLYLVHNSVTSNLAYGSITAPSTTDLSVPLAPRQFIVTNTNRVEVILRVYHNAAGSKSIYGILSGTPLTYLTIKYISTNTVFGG